MIDRLAVLRACGQAPQVRVDYVLVALDREQERDVDVHAASSELLDRGQTGLGAGDLDHHVGSVQALPQVLGLRERAVGVVGEVGRALERDQAVVSGRAVVRRTQQPSRLTDVVERQCEEQLLGVAHSRGGDRTDLVVVEIRSRQGLGEDRRVGGRAGDAVLVDQLLELAALQKVPRERVKPDRHAGVV